MSNYKDNNADLGNQTIEGTESPYAVEAEIVMPEDEQPVIILAEPMDADHVEAVVTPMPDDAIFQPVSEDPIITPAADEPVIALAPDEPTQAATDIPITEEDLDAQLAAMLGEDEQKPAADEPTQDAVDLDAQLAAELDAQLAAMLNEQAELENEHTTEQPITQPVNNEQNQGDSDAAARAMLEQAQAIMEQAKQAQMQAEAKMQAATMYQAPPRQSEDKAADAARAMFQQAQMMMQQAQAAQMQAQQAAQAAQLHAQQAAAPPIRRVENSETEAARMMMEQAKRLMEQAQAAQMQAQMRTTASPYGTDPYALKEVDRLKNELDGMRELVNKLTFAMSQSANAGQAMGGQPYYGSDRDKYRELESELEKMRRDIKEKDLRDREKELDRRQKEAENVRDIRPEMMQMSDSRDVMPIAPPQQSIGNEYIPIANGVYYSTKDKQVYVMTPASGAAAANPTIERPRPAAKRPAARRPAARPRPGHRRPGMSARRRPGPRRPHR